jgi:very-short-patch-repair endonuclease
MRSSDLGIPFRGVRSAHGDPDFAALCRAYAERMTSIQCFSHITAARLWDIPLPRSCMAENRLHVSSLGGTRPRIRGAIGHEISDKRYRLVEVDALRVTDPASRWLQLVSFLMLDELVIAGDHLVAETLTHRPHALCSREALADRARGIRGHRMSVVRHALELIRCRSESPRETRLRLALVRHGLPEPELNFEIRDELGTFIARADMGYPAFKVLVEYDGEQHRTDSWQYHRDVERHDALLADGWVHIRARKHSPTTGERAPQARAERALRERGAVFGARASEPRGRTVRPLPSLPRR